MRCLRPVLLSSRHEDAVGGCELDVLKLRFQPHTLQARLFFWLRQKSEQVLMVQSPANVIEIWREGNRRFIAKEISLASSFLSHFGKIILSPVHAEEAVPVVADASGVYCVDDDARLLRLLNASVNVRIRWANATEIVDAIGDN